jgi:predicted nucleotidyltransferase
MGSSNSDILKAVSDFLETLQRSDVELEAAYLYGSYATGKAHEDSDIDVALVSRVFDDHLEGQKRVIDALLVSDARIEAVRFVPDEFCDENPLVWEIKTKGIKLL